MALSTFGVWVLGLLARAKVEGLGVASRSRVFGSNGPILPGTAGRLLGDLLESCVVLCYIVCLIIADAI